MSITQTLTRNFKSGSEEIPGTVEITSDTEIKQDVVLANGAVTANLYFLDAGLKGIFLKSDIAVSIVFKDAPGGSTVATLALTAGCPWGWTHKDPVANPFSDDVQEIVATAAAIGNLNIRVLTDAIP